MTSPRSLARGLRLGVTAVAAAAIAVALSLSPASADDTGMATGTASGAGSSSGSSQSAGGSTATPATPDTSGVAGAISGATGGSRSGASTSTVFPCPGGSESGLGPDFGSGMCSNLHNRYLGPERIFPRDLYRGDTRSPDDVFAGGFTARGTNYDVVTHVHGGDRAPASGYISTTGSLSMAEVFARGQGLNNLFEAGQLPGCSTGRSAVYFTAPYLSRLWRLLCSGIPNTTAQNVSARSYVYTIDPVWADNAFYVPDQLAGDPEMQGIYAPQDEWAYVRQIPNYAIVGVRMYTMTATADNGVPDPRTVTFTYDQFVANPNHVNMRIYQPANDTNANWNFNTDLNLPPSTSSAAMVCPSLDSCSGTRLRGTVTVAADGSGDYKKVQDAINALPTDGAPRTISIAKGVYHEVVTVPAKLTHLTIRGATGNSSDVVIYAGNAHGMLKLDGTPYGTQGSATATFRGADLVVTGVKIMNTFDPAAHPEVGFGETQAVAVTAIGDRQIYSNDQFISTQDTVLAKSTAPTAQTRQYFVNDYLKGTVDFLFGDATAVFDHCALQEIDRGPTLGGNVVAPNTDSSKKYGILITNSTLTASSAPGTFTLGRPWHNTATAIGQTVIRDSILPAGIKVAAPWTDMTLDFSWKSARFSEYHNSGAGAAVNANRPQLTDAQAAEYTTARYLAGTDGWRPAG